MKLNDKQALGVLKAKYQGRVAKILWWRHWLVDLCFWSAVLALAVYLAMYVRILFYAKDKADKVELRIQQYIKDTQNDNQ